MSAVDQMRAMLDQLMGTSRNGDADGRNHVHFDDASVCRSFLLDCCPHDILEGTRADIGACAKFHDLALRADYNAAQKQKDYFFERDALEHLKEFIGESDRKTEMAKKKLAAVQDELTEDATEKMNAIHTLGEQIGTKLAKAEELGATGEVEESLRFLEEVETLKKEKQGLELEFRNSISASSYQQQKLRVCEVCSAYLGIHDNDRRLADHFGGKLHVGFIKIREKLSELKEIVEEKMKKREKEREERNRRSDGQSTGNRERREPEPSRERSRENRDTSSRELGRESSREQLREPARRRSRSRSPDRSRHRHYHGSGSKYRGDSRGYRNCDENPSTSERSSRRHREDD